MPKEKLVKDDPSMRWSVKKTFTHRRLNIKHTETRIHYLSNVEPSSVTPLSWLRRPSCKWKHMPWPYGANVHQRVCGNVQDCVLWKKISQKIWYVLNYFVYETRFYVLNSLMYAETETTLLKASLQNMTLDRANATVLPGSGQLSIAEGSLLRIMK